MTPQWVLIRTHMHAVMVVSSFKSHAACICVRIAVTME